MLIALFFLLWQIKISPDTTKYPVGVLDKV
jgi:hypothetical protein